LARPYILVVGASAGGVGALEALVRHLPPDLPAAVFVILHTPPHFDSQLPEILSRAGRLPAVHARGGERIATGRIYVAPPDRHLLVCAETIELSRGPRENHARPAVDPTMRTAARLHGPAVTGVLLSGTLGDGTLGLMAIKARGGVTIVQDPQEAAHPGMAEHALHFVEVDHVLPIREIAGVVAGSVAVHRAEPEAVPMKDPEDQMQHAIQRNFTHQVQGRRSGAETIYTCPDCGGILWQSEQDSVTGFRCYSGHSYASERLLEEKSVELETALWSAVRALVERSTLNRQLAMQLQQRGLETRATALLEQAEQDEAHIRLLRRGILHADEGDVRSPEEDRVAAVTSGVED
jgi:two-component system, chemotaxis family, protein-glutamate methylesterase/glutaminase